MIIVLTVKDLLTGEKLTDEQISFLVSGADNKTDYMTLNKIEQRIYEIHGKDLYTNSESKIQYIANLILNKDIAGMSVFYSGCLEQYIAMNQQNDIGQFNIMFITLVHITLKILRKTQI